MKLIKTQHRLYAPAIAVCHHANNPDKIVYLYWNCGWHLTSNPNLTFSHKEKETLFPTITKPRPHRTCPVADNETKNWQRINNIYYIHNNRRVICRVSDGLKAIIRCPETDAFIDIVPFSNLTESRKFPTGFTYKGNKAIPKPKPTTTRPKTKLQKQIATIQTIDLDKLLDL